MLYKLEHMHVVGGTRQFDPEISGSNYVDDDWHSVTSPAP